MTTISGDLLLLAFLTCVLAACASAPAVERPEVRITALEPDSAPAGIDYPVDLTILGQGFAPRNNTVHFGPVLVGDYASEDGRITIPVPKEIPSSSEAPPRVLLPGRYEVVVETEDGRSPPAVFVLTPAPVGRQ